MLDPSTVDGLITVSEIQIFTYMRVEMFESSRLVINI